MKMFTDLMAGVCGRQYLVTFDARHACLCRGAHETR